MRRLFLPAMRRLFLIVLLGLANAAALAVDPAEVLDDPVLEARARQIGKGLRCLVCQNQSIDDSDASLAKDLRILVRERLTAGDGDQQVIDYVVSRYGDFVLLKPRIKPYTLVLWLGPLAIAGMGAAALVYFFRRRKTAAAVKPLSAAEKKKLQALLDGKP